MPKTPKKESPARVPGRPRSTRFCQITDNVRKSVLKKQTGTVRFAMSGRREILSFRQSIPYLELRKDFHGFKFSTGHGKNDGLIIRWEPRA